MVNVRDHRSGMTVSAVSWAAWRTRWDRRPMSLAHRVRLCAWCWGFGALVEFAGAVLPIPCLACGREGTVPPPRPRVEAVPCCPTCGRPR